MRIPQLMQRLISPGAMPVDSERRQCWRISRRVPLIGQRRQGQQFSLLTVNLGPGGLRVEAPVALRAGEEIRLRPEDRLPQDGLPARVVWCRLQCPGTWLAGLAFANLAEQRPVSVDGLLQSCGVRIQNPQEQRKAPRLRTVHVDGFLYTDDHQVNAIEVVDVAVGGALVSSPRRLEMNTPLRLRITLGGRGEFETRGRVVRVRHGEGEGISLLAVAFQNTAPRQRSLLIVYLAAEFRSIRV